MSNIVFRLLPLFFVVGVIVLSAFFRVLDRWTRSLAKMTYGEKLDAVAKGYGLKRKGTGPWWFILRENDFSLEQRAALISTQMMIAKYIAITEIVTIYYDKYPEAMENDFKEVLETIIDLPQLPQEFVLADKREKNIGPPKV